MYIHKFILHPICFIVIHVYCNSCYLCLWYILGVLGIKVKIMLPWDPNGKSGPKKPLPDYVSIVEPKEEVPPSVPISEVKPSKDIPQPTPLAV